MTTDLEITLRYDRKLIGMLLLEAEQHVNRIISFTDTPSGSST